MRFVFRHTFPAHNAKPEEKQGIKEAQIFNARDAQRIGLIDGVADNLAACLQQELLPDELDSSVADKTLVIRRVKSPSAFAMMLGVTSGSVQWEEQ